jgi:DNA polymerase III delta prime subunit
MWLCWGGDAGIEWASRKLKQIRKEELSEDERYETMLEILNSDFEKNNKIEDLKNLLK